MPNSTIADLTRRSIATIPESELVERLLSNQQWRSRLLGLHGIPSDVITISNVPLGGLPGEPKGDIDILMIPPGRPSESITAQVKRIKVHDGTFQTERPNKLHEVAKGARQANILARLGFAQVYYFVFVVVDSRARNGGGINFGGLTPSLDALIDAEITVEGLDDRVGLMHFEFVQPMDDEPLRTGTYSGHMKRMAVPAIQPSLVTDWVAAVKERHA